MRGEVKSLIVTNLNNFSGLWRRGITPSFPFPDAHLIKVGRDWARVREAREENAHALGAKLFSLYF